jgi:predicted O-methyltransferase YrrM
LPANRKVRLFFRQEQRWPAGIFIVRTAIIWQIISYELMNPLLEGIFSTGQFKTSAGDLVKVHSETPRDQCIYLQEMISAHGYRFSLEIGLAFGISALAIGEAVVKNAGRHLVMDKYQYNVWGGHGVDLIKQAGYEDHIEFREEFCYELLPKLLEEGRVFDFVYIDSTKLFDWLMVDFFYIDKMLDPGGMIVFDDLKFGSIRKLLRYIAQLPHYQVYRQYPGNEPMELKWKMAGALKYIPGMKKILRDELLVTDESLGLNARCVALKKIKTDERYYDWHVKF